MKAEQCELRWCASKKQDKRLIDVSECIEDAAFRVSICQTCADALGIGKGSDLPEADTVKRLIYKYKREHKLQTA